MTDKTLLDLFEKIRPRDLVLMEDIDAAGGSVESRDKTTEHSHSKNESCGDENDETDFADDSDSAEEESQTWAESASSGDTWSTWGAETSGTDKSKKSKSKHDGKRTKPRETVTLSGLLNALDGPNSPEGYVIFMTSNHPEKLDAALVRQGRIDQMIKLDYVVREQLRDLFCMFYAPSKSGLDTSYDIATIPAQAEAFANMVPEHVLTPAQVLGHFFDHRVDPQGALDSTVAWLNSKGIQPLMTNVPSTPAAPASSDEFVENDSIEQIPDLAYREAPGSSPAGRFCEPVMTNQVDNDLEDLSSINSEESSPSLPLTILQPHPEPSSSVDEKRPDDLD